MEIAKKKDTSNIAFEGVFPAVVTPMTPEGQINEDAFRKVIEFNIQAGVHGFWVAGGSGESILLDDEENQRLAEIVVDQSRGRVINIMHVGAPTTARAARLAEHAARSGVDAICCVPPFFYRRTDEEMVEYYRVVAAAADLPLLVYNLPYSTGVEITPAMMQKIQDGVPQLAGLKHSAMTFGNVSAFAQMGLQCLIGNCRLMLPALISGATGCVDGPPSMFPEIWMELWDAYRGGDMERAKAAQSKAQEMIAGIFELGSGFHAVLKAVLSERLGIDCGGPRPPGLPMTVEQRAALRERLAELGVGAAVM